MMNVNTRKIFDEAKAKAVHRFGTSNLNFFVYRVFDGWKLDIRLDVMENADKIFDMYHGEIHVMDDGTTKLIHRQKYFSSRFPCDKPRSEETGEVNTVDELMDVLDDRLTKMYKAYKDYARMETEKLLEAL